CDWDKHFKLTADIDLNGYAVSVIGTDYDNAFTGVFDGNGHTISNLTQNSTGTDNIGLFGYAYGAVMKDLGLINPNVDGGTGNHVGSLIGKRFSGELFNCYVQGGTVAGANSVGGLVGDNVNRPLSNCYASTSVSGTKWVGGLAGRSHGGITNCFSGGTVSGTTDVGGLVGGFTYQMIFDSYSTATVWGNTNVGGLVGYVEDIYDYGTRVVSYCYSTGSVSGTTNVGGLIGRSDPATLVESSFWDTQTSGQASSPGGGTGKTTAQMQNPNTFLDAGWDFVGETANGLSELWAERDGGGYMILWWQLSPIPELPSFSGGSGTPEDPYLISTGNELNSIDHNPRLMTAHFKLINDLDLTGVSLFGIGLAPYPFTGGFDGNDHSISNFAYNSSGTDYVGLLRYVGHYTTNVEIKNVRLINPDVDAGTGSYVGSLLGYADYGTTISNCHVENARISGDKYIGGLAGYIYQSECINCTASGEISGGNGGRVGGLVGFNYYSHVADCNSSGSVSASGEWVGGLVGSSFGDSSITNSSSSSTVSGNEETGGLAGYGDGIVADCHATGSVDSSDRYAGGLLGRGSATNCYATGRVTAALYDAGGLLGSGSAVDCYATGDVSAVSGAGGLVGYGTATNSYATGTVTASSGTGSAGGLIASGEATNCYAAGNVSGGSMVGGLVGSTSGDTVDCYAMGSVTGNSSVGGLAGWINDNGISRGRILRCYSTGPVSGGSYVGGLVGTNTGRVEDCFWDKQTSELDNMCGRQGGEFGNGCDDDNGKTTAQMQTESTFTSAGWDF
ncbi:MAG: GLUG motif-containing protein, partial [Planctomycetota bacterium]